MSIEKLARSERGGAEKNYENLTVFDVVVDLVLLRPEDREYFGAGRIFDELPMAHEFSRGVHHT